MRRRQGRLPGLDRAAAEAEYITGAGPPTGALDALLDRKSPVVWKVSRDLDRGER